MLSVSIIVKKKKWLRFGIKIVREPYGKFYKIQTTIKTSTVIRFINLFWLFWNFRSCNIFIKTRYENCTIQVP